jgi:hypothetical protein
MTIDRDANSMMSAQDAVSKMMTDHVVDLTTTVRVVATAASMTVPVTVVLRMKRNRVVAVRAMSAKKTRCMTVRKPLAKSA